MLGKYHVWLGYTCVGLGLVVVLGLIISWKSAESLHAEDGATEFCHTKWCPHLDEAIYPSIHVQLRFLADV